VGIRDRIVELRRVNTADLLDNAGNWRIHPQAQHKALVSLIEQVGIADALIAYYSERNGGALTLIDGHLRKESYSGEWPVLVTDLDDGEADVLLASLDPLTMMAGTAVDRLRALAAKVGDQLDEGLRDRLDLMAAEAQRRLEIKRYDSKPHDDAPAAWLREKWGVTAGQLWQVPSLLRPGVSHRILCADNTDDGAIADLLAGTTVDAVITDPPYDMAGSVVRTCLTKFAKRAVVLTDCSQAFQLCGDDWEFCKDLIWRHRTPRSTPSPYIAIHYHHHIVMLSRQDEKLGWKRPRKDFGDVIELAEEYVDHIMPYGKSVALFQEMLIGFRWEKWADPFLGSGASLLACEEQAKILFGMEIDPATLAVALERISQTGMRPDLA